MKDPGDTQEIQEALDMVTVAFENINASISNLVDITTMLAERISKLESR